MEPEYLAETLECCLPFALYGLSQDGVFRPEWRTEAVIGLARGILDDSAFERMPILADALEEAGCTDLRLLAHCRAPVVHDHQCWALGFALNRSVRPEQTPPIEESPRRPVNWAELWKRMDDGVDHTVSRDLAGFSLRDLFGHLMAVAIYLWVVGMILYAVVWFVIRR